MFDARPPQDARPSRTRVRLPVPLLLLLALLALATTGCGALKSAEVDLETLEGSFSQFAGKLEVRGLGQIASVASVADLPLSMTVLEAGSQSPVAQVEVEFLALTPSAALLYDGREEGRFVVPTDRDGRAAVHLKVPKKPQDFWVRVQVHDPATGQVVASKVVVTHGVDPRKLLFAFLGGLAIFLFGMKLMTQGLQAIAGDRLRTVLATLTRRRLVGLMAGAVITAMIQSSSATTVMTVGLVNAGLLTLTQAVPVMFGANIGTTITGQLIAFKIKDYAFPIMFFGLGLQFLGATRRRRIAGEVLMGLGLLFYGMTLMEGVFKPLSHSAAFREIFVGFSVNPFYGVLAGTVVTVLVQSSSATVGLTLTLAGSGFVDFKGAFSLILGDNIGTTVTALLASLGGRAAARRAALVHTLFNVTGAALMLGLLYVEIGGRPIYLMVVDQLTMGDAFADPPQNIERHVANSHSFFNVIFAICFLPLSGWFARLATAIVPADDDEAEGVPNRLAPALIETPGVALKAVRVEMADLAQQLREMLELTMLALLEGQRDAVDAVIRAEDRVDQRREDISAYLVRISERELSPGDAEAIPRMLHAVNDLERFGDLTEEAAKLARRRIEKELPFSDEAIAEVRELHQKLDLMLTASVELLRDDRQDRFQEVKSLERQVDRLEKRTRKAHVRRLQEQQCDLMAGIVFLDTLTILEKMGDFLDNVANAMSGDLEGPDA